MCSANVAASVLERGPCDELRASWRRYLGLQDFELAKVLIRWSCWDSVSWSLTYRSYAFRVYMKKKLGSMLVV